MAWMDDKHREELLVLRHLFFLRKGSFLFFPLLTGGKSLRRGGSRPGPILDKAKTTVVVVGRWMTASQTLSNPLTKFPGIEAKRKTQSFQKKREPLPKFPNCLCVCFANVLAGFEQHRTRDAKFLQRKGGCSSSRKSVSGHKETRRRRNQQHQPIPPGPHPSSTEMPSNSFFVLPSYLVPPPHPKDPQLHEPSSS